MKKNDFKKISKKINFELVDINNNHIKILYDLLVSRKFKISNIKLPSYKEHKSFVIKNPYRKWYLLSLNYNYIGSAYITYENTLGIDIPDIKNYEYISEILQVIYQNIKPLKEKKSVRSGQFSINVSPANLKFISILEKMGFKTTQITLSK